MKLDDEEQKEIILNALRNCPIQGDYQGLSEALPKFKAVIEAVESAEISDKPKIVNRSL